MNTENFEILVEFGEFISCCFTAIKLKEDENGTTTYARMEDGTLDSVNGMLSISEANERLSLSYDTFDIIANIVCIQKENDTTRLNCVAGKLQIGITISSI